MTHDPTPMEELEKNYTLFWFENIDGYTMFGAVHKTLMEKYTSKKWHTKEAQT